MGQQGQQQTHPLASVARLVVIYLVLAQAVDSTGVRKFEEIDDGASDYTNHVVAFEANSIGFEKIEEYLQDNVRDEVTRTNMEAAKKLLDIENRRPVKDAKLLRALEMFVDLEKLLDESTCNHHGYDFLINLKTATKYRIDRRTTKRRRFFVPLRRIELLMSRFALEHARRCKDIYPSNYARLYASLESAKIELIDAFMNEVIKNRLGGRSNGFISRDDATTAKLNRIYSSFIEKNDSFKKPEDAKIAHTFIRRVSKVDPETTGDHASEEQVEKYFLDNIVSPCDHYVQVMATDIFVPAQLDSNLLDKADKYKLSAGEGHNGFITGWARFGFCSMLQRDKNILIKKLVSL